MKTIINLMSTNKHLLRYLNRMRSLGIRLLADTPLTLHGFYDADWAGNPDDRTCRCFFSLSFLVLIQFLGALQSNALLLVLQMRLNIVQNGYYCRTAMGEIIIVGTSSLSAFVAHPVLG